MIKLKQKIFVRTCASGRRRVSTTEPPAEVAPGRIPRVSRLMALAIKFEQLLQSGEVRDQSELARLAHVTQPRMSQIMNLLHLAPDIQEELLFLPRVEKGKDPIHEKMLRPIAAEMVWEIQRKTWLCMQHKIRQK